MWRRGGGMWFCDVVMCWHGRVLAWWCGGLGLRWAPMHKMQLSVADVTMHAQNATERSHVTTHS